MTAPEGLGWWVAFESAFGASKSARLALATDRALRTGATWIAPRAGDGASHDRDFDELSLAAYSEPGFSIYPWVFARRGRTPDVVANLQRFVDHPNVCGCIINAEFEYAKESPEEARKLVASLRAVGFDWVAHAPPDGLGSQGGTPALVALDEVCDAILPQVYAWEHNDAGHVVWLDHITAAYSKRGFGTNKVWPVLCSYRPKTRGFDKAGRGIPTPPLANEAARVASDLLAGLEHHWVTDCPAPSIYSLDAISSINGKEDRVIAALESPP